MAGELVLIEPGKLLRYVPLLAAGVLVFLGLVFLGDLTGLLWHSRTFGWWIELSPSLFGLTTDWVVWATSFLLSICPSIIALARKRARPDLVLLLASFIFPFLSLAIVSRSYYVGATLLVGSGFLAAYTLVSRSKTLLGLETGYAARLACTEVFAFLAVMAAGGVVSVLLWQVGAFTALRLSGGDVSLMHGWLGMFAIDLEAFYLVRSLLSAIFITLGASAAVDLFSEPLRSVARSVLNRLRKEQDADGNPASATLAPRSVGVTSGPYLPYLMLALSVVLAVVITLYPYTIADVDRVLGSDSWFYLEKLGSMRGYADAFRETDRGFVLFVLFVLKTLTGFSTEWVVKLMPTVSSVLLVLSTCMLVREGTGRPYVAAFAALLSVVSAQTSLGMGAGIIANWFSLSVANFALALIVRSIRHRSALAALGSLAVLFILLASYAYMWVVALAVVVLALAASLICFRWSDRREWKYEVKILSGVLVGSILVPVGFLFLGASPLLGFQPPGLNPSLWFAQGWDYLKHATTPEVIGSSLAALEEAFDYAGNRVDLPFLTLLSIIGLLDHSSQTRAFGRIIAAMILVPVTLTLITTSLFSTWRGLYIIPLYLTGALGAERIIHGVNGQQPSWTSRSRVAFAGTFAGYIFLSHVAYSLRALELLILVGSR